MITADDVAVTYNRNGTIELAIILRGYRYHSIVFLSDDETVGDAVAEFVAGLAS